MKWFFISTPKITENRELLALGFPLSCVSLTVCLMSPLSSYRLPEAMSSSPAFLVYDYLFLFPGRCCTVRKHKYLFPIFWKEQRKWLIHSPTAASAEPGWYQPGDWGGSLTPHPRISREPEPSHLHPKQDKVAWLSPWSQTSALTTLPSSWCRNKIEPESVTE